MLVTVLQSGLGRNFFLTKTLLDLGGRQQIGRYKMIHQALIEDFTKNLYEEYCCEPTSLDRILKKH